MYCLNPPMSEPPEGKFTTLTSEEEQVELRMERHHFTQ